MELKDKLVTQVGQVEEAIQRLSESIEQPKNEFIRDSVIQRFEFCFEMSWKVMQSALIFIGKECASPRQCIRLAAQNNFLANPEKWLEYQDARNLSSHTYKEDTADKVYDEALLFLDDAKQLCKEIRAYLSQEK